jgi:D-alanyl-D-alanine carboxypeptidase/D-alanyl-D-alanine-endopeptidase (penicillin-binding protein 4)
MVKTLRQSGVQTIQGNIIIDDTALDRMNTAPGWKPKWQLLCYAAPTSSIILNRNCFGLNLIAGKQSGAATQVRYSDNLGAISAINQVTTRHACALDVKTTVDGNNYLLSGCIAPRRAAIGLALPLNDPRKAGTNILFALLREQGITVSGGVGYAKTPGNLQLLAEHDSPTLRYLITQMLKKSDNLIANTLFKKLGSVYFHTTGTWTNGVQAVRVILGSHTGIDFSNVTMLDGCGLSPGNQVTPGQFAALLNYVYHFLPNKEVFYAALPRSGIDGTLRNRLGGATLDKIHAKTGTIDDVSALAGYVETAHHQTLTFAIMINSLGNNQASYHLLEDRICRFLATK